jgi:competence protein ComEA
MQTPVGLAGRLTLEPDSGCLTASDHFMFSQNEEAFLKIPLIMMAFCLLLTVNPATADTGAKSPATNEKADQQAASIDPVNINKADVETLATLKGIGKDRAQKIIQYREKNGPFQKPEDLMKVKGIGKKIFDQNKDFILI